MNERMNRLEEVASVALHKKKTQPTRPDRKIEMFTYSIKILYK